MAERLANDFQTTVGVGGITGSATSLPVNAAAPAELRDAAGLAAGFTIRVEDADAAGRPTGVNIEFMRVISSGAAGASPWVVRRAYEDSTRYPAAIHAAGSVVTPLLTAGVVNKLSALQRTSGLFLGGSPCADNLQLARLDESDGVILQSTSRSIHRLPRGASGIRLVYASVRVSFPSGPPFGEGTSSTGGNHDVKAAIERSGGTIEPVYFSARRQATMEPSGFLVSDIVPISELDGADIWVRSRASAASGVKWPYQRNLRSELGEGIENSVDKVDSGTITAATLPGYVPVAIISDDNCPSVAMEGDSIVWGVGDTDIEPNKGFMRRALNRGFGYVALARSGDRMEYVASPGIYKVRLLLAMGCDSAISNFGINDVGGVSGPAGALGTRTAVQLEADWVTFAKMHDRANVAWYATTLMPYSSSTDSWATVANQTAFPATTDRTDANDWLRDGCPIDATTKLRVATGTSSNVLRTVYIAWNGSAFIYTGNRAAGHPIAGVFEIADLVESSRNSGKWKVDGTAFKYVNNDTFGIHPSAFGHQEAAKGINVAELV